MLEKLDAVVAFVTLLLGISLLITILNQMIASLLGHRAAYLKDGIKDLLETLDPQLKPHLETIANDILTHKLVSDSVFVHQSWAPRRWKMASTIHSEELAKLLPLVSQGKDYSTKIETLLNEVNPTLKRETALLGTLYPGATAKGAQVVQEVSNATTKAVGRLESAFDSTLDRVRQRFTLQMRVWTIIFSLMFAFVYHMDSKALYSRLSTDPAWRASLNTVSDDLLKTYASIDQSKDPDVRTKNLTKAYKKVRAELSESDPAIFQISSPWYDWRHRELPGILGMAALLSLGAPFWYNALKNIVNLQSQVAQKQQKG
jgi:hypothetical protein